MGRDGILRTVSSVPDIWKSIAITSARGVFTLPLARFSLVFSLYRFSTVLTKLSILAALSFCICSVKWA